jgi:peptidylprolyl isomerase
MLHTKNLKILQTYKIETIIMKPKALFIFLMLTTAIGSFAQINVQKEIKFKIETDSGTIICKLYNETPSHRDNFIKLIKCNFYVKNNFHRIIKNFMIQGGDIPVDKSKSFKDSFNYTIKAEIIPNLIHKKGALCSARMGDNVNPNKESSGTQFYIVQGEKQNTEALKNIENQINYNNFKNIAVNFYKQEEKKLKAEGKTPNYKQLEDTAVKYANGIVKLNPYKFTEKQIDTYLKLGGTPHLDSNYTVFGEVIEGLEVVDKLASVKTVANDKPEKEVKFTISLIE